MLSEPVLISRVSVAPSGLVYVIVTVTKLWVGRGEHVTLTWFKDEHSRLYKHMKGCEHGNYTDHLIKDIAIGAPNHPSLKYWREAQGGLSDFAKRLKREVETRLL